MHVVAFEEVLVVPLGHVVQLTLPGCGANVPGLQLKQFEEPDEDAAVPGLQGVHFFVVGLE